MSWLSAGWVSKTEVTQQMYSLTFGDKRPKAGAQNECSFLVTPALCLRSTLGFSSDCKVVLHAGPSASFNGVETLSDCWLREWEHLIEAASSNRKQEASLWEKKKREQCLLHIPDKGPIIKITGRVSWPLGAWMNDHYMHDGGKLSLCNSEQFYVLFCVWIGFHSEL